MDPRHTQLTSRKQFRRPLLTGVGLTHVTTIAAHPGAPTMTAGRRP